ncbi:MAG: capsule biosynthesis protein [Pseudomonadota bacterium]
MTTRPKGRKFRIRRGYGSADATTSAPVPATSAAVPRHPAPSPDVAPAEPVPETPKPAASPAAPKPIADPPRETADGPKAAPATPANDARPSPAPTDAPGAAQPAPATAAPSPNAGRPAGARNEEPEIAAIRAEGLSGRQLRMARRTALKHGITASSDFDAVRQLRARGIDPFARSNMLELIVSDDPAAMGQAPEATLPATRPTTAPASPRAPAGLPDEAGRAEEIMRVQRDIAKRRQKRLALLGTRLAFFVLLPTLIAAYYFYVIATPLYATNSEFVIQKAESGAGGGGLSSFLGGTSFATVQESISVQSFLEGREAVQRLDAELGFRDHFSAPGIDPLIRLAADASEEDVYALYRRMLDIGYDPTEGLVRMELRAADPETSQAFSAALISYAEEHVDQMSSRIREAQMDGARDSFEEAEAQLLAAQQRVLTLQEQRGVLSTEAEVSTVFQQITTLELELQQERLRLSELLSVERPNETRVLVTRQNIARLEEIIAELRDGLTTAEGDQVSLARISSELIVAQADMETRQVMLAQALQQMETARIEANRQSLYLSISVFPVAPDEAAYPKPFENTLLTLLVFSGIYLLLSMTASILREQVSA